MIVLVLQYVITWVKIDNYFIYIIISLQILLLSGNQSQKYINDCIINDIYLIKTDHKIATKSTLKEISRRFCHSNKNEYDFLVIWGDDNFSPPSAFYLPIKNDITGIGYKNAGEELFDRSKVFGCDNLQGIIWIGSSWIKNYNERGNSSVLSTLAHETAHRWVGTLKYYDERTGQSSNLLMGKPKHWTFYLNTSESPLGGNKWVSLGNDYFKAVPVDNVRYNPLELYLMGLIDKDEIPPIQLLTNIRDENDNPNLGYRSDSNRVKTEIIIKADMQEISIDNIIQIEGERDPENIGFNAKVIRQAWIYPYIDHNNISKENLTALKELQTLWTKFYYHVTSGYSSILIFSNTNNQEMSTCFFDNNR